MTEKDLSQIEKQLKIALPHEYRELMLARAAELREAGCFNDDLSMFYLDPKEVISANKSERPKDSGTGYAFPQWWETFFLVGTNGGGDYYCLRLDNKPGVWMIGSDCGDKPTRVAGSLKAFVDKLLKKHKEGQERAAQRQEVVHEEEAEELQAIAEAGNAKAKDWLAAQSPYSLFDYLDNLGCKPSPRKLRLFGIACCQRIKSFTADDDCAQALQLADKLVSSTAPARAVADLSARLKTRYEANLNGSAEMWSIGAARNLLQADEDYCNRSGDADLKRVWNSVSSAVIAQSPNKLLTEGQALSDLLREVLGNPFLPVRFERGWQTAAAVSLAQAIYDDQAFDRLPALADALAAAGCDNQRILKHCRKKAGHVRGCWVLDLVLGLAEAAPKEEEYAWDYKWEHPTIDAKEFRQQIQAFGTDAMGNDNDMAGAALAFADWLEKKGDQTWAKYIRVCSALSGKAPFRPGSTPKNSSVEIEASGTCSRIRKNAGLLPWKKSPHSCECGYNQ